MVRIPAGDCCFNAWLGYDIQIVSICHCCTVGYPSGMPMQRVNERQLRPFGAIR